MGGLSFYWSTHRLGEFLEVIMQQIKGGEVLKEVRFSVKGIAPVLKQAELKAQHQI